MLIIPYDLESNGIGKKEKYSRKKSLDEDLKDEVKIQICYN